MKFIITDFKILFTTLLLSVLPSLAIADTSTVKSNAAHTASCTCQRGYYFEIGARTHAYYQIPQAEAEAEPATGMVILQALPEGWHLLINKEITNKEISPVKPGAIWTQWLRQQANQHQWAVLVDYDSQTVYINPLWHHWL